MKDELSHIISISSAALEAEDKAINLAMIANRSSYLQCGGGILEVNNERYYQFVIARALIFGCPYRTAVEWKSHDVALLHPQSNVPAVTIEMKRWMSSSGERELAGIRNDMTSKLAKVSTGLKLMLIFSANKPGESEIQANWMTDRLHVSRSAWELRHFPTMDSRGEKAEFFVAGIEVD